MLKLVVRRVLFSVLTLAVVAVMVFLLTELLPGDVATAYFGREATPERLAQMRRDLGLDRPVAERFWRWISHAARGDLGRSLIKDKPVVDIIRFPLRNTVVLGLLTACITLPTFILLGVIAGLFRDRWLDFLISIGSLVGWSTPGFVVGSILLLTLSIKLRLLPAVVVVGSGNEPLSKLYVSMIMPALTLSIIWGAYLVRMVRTSVIDVMTGDFVQMATLKGMPYRTVVFRHALPSALVPSINVAALLVGAFVGGTVVLETLFNYPGLGRQLVYAISDRDVPVVEAIALIAAVMTLTINLAADLSTMVLNPRLRSLRG